jgi:diguanylate cyclase (GGDEF)-like protein
MTAATDAPLTAERLLDLSISRGTAFGVAIALVLAISIGDYLTGPYLVWATFYLVPVVLAAWFCGRTPALVVGAIAAVVGATSTALDPGEVTAPVYVANGIFRFITYALIAVLVDAERTAMRTIRELSAVDPLTGMWNRRRFYEEAELELARARRSGRPLAVVYVDVDDLKLRNDTYGHQAGDEMLSEFAEIARAAFRTTDLLARLGGDEFCVMLPEADLATAGDVVGRFVEALRHARSVPIRVSVGIVAGPVEDDVQVETVVHAADELMYQAKTSGKGQLRTRAALVAPRSPDPPNADTLA